MDDKKNKKLIKNSKIEIRIDQSFKEELQNIANSRHISLSALLMTWISERYEKEKRPSPGAILLESGNEK